VALKSCHGGKQWIGLFVFYFTGHLVCYLRSILSNNTSLNTIKMRIYHMAQL